MPGEQGGGAGEGRQIPGRAVQPERRGETALPDGPAIKGRNTPARLPPRFPAPGKCTSHLGFGLVSARICRRALSSEAVATVNRAVASGQERHRGVLAALGANDRVHFPTTSIEAVIVALGPLGLAAGWATLGLVGVALFSVVRLIISAEDEGLTALVTGEGSILVSHL